MILWYNQLGASDYPLPIILLLSGAPYFTGGIVMHPAIWILIALIVILVWPKRRAYYRYLAGFTGYWICVGIGKVLRRFR